MTADLDADFQGFDESNPFAEDVNVDADESKHLLEELNDSGDEIDEKEKNLAKKYKSHWNRLLHTKDIENRLVMVFVFYFSLFAFDFFFEVVVVRCGSLLFIVVHCGSLWMVVDGCGWLWLAVGGCGWLWMVVVGCRWL